MKKGSLVLHLHASPMLKGTVKVKIFLDSHSGMHLGSLHMQEFVYRLLVHSLERGGVSLTFSGPYTHEHLTVESASHALIKKAKATEPEDFDAIEPRLDDATRRTIAAIRGASGKSV